MSLESRGRLMDLTPCGREIIACHHDHRRAFVIAHKQKTRRLGRTGLFAGDNDLVRRGAEMAH
jgi:hypothetical protein